MIEEETRKKRVVKALKRMLIRENVTHDFWEKR